MTPQPSEQPRTAYPSMRYRLAAALHMAANLPEYNLSHRMMSVHGGPGDMSYLDAADMILGTQPMLDYAYEAAAPDPVASPAEALVERIRTALPRMMKAALPGAFLQADDLALGAEAAGRILDDEARRYLASATEGETAE